MASTITSGTVVSFGNTPQARDDLYGLTEDQLAGIVCLDVMANDLGGNAKSLYSLDDSVSAGGTRPSDLLVQDAVGVVNYTKLGAKIWITATGKVAYDATGLGFDSLDDGETKTDPFTYANRLGNGALSWATATVTITGSDDQPTLQAVTSGSVKEVDQSASTIDSGLTGTLV